MSVSEIEYHFEFKVVVVGSAKVGKSTLIDQLLQNTRDKNGVIEVNGIKVKLVLDENTRWVK